jgi:hypothetical protein
MNASVRTRAPWTAAPPHLDAPARAVRTDYENTVKAVITKNAALIAKARFALEGKGTYPDATFA